VLCREYDLSGKWNIITEARGTVMKKVAVVTDSTCCLPSDLIQKYEIQLIPIYIIYQGRSYRDRIDITPGEIYKIMRARKDLPTTSVSSPEEFLETYHQLSQKTDSILCITVTSLQSGVFNMAFTAKEMAREKLPDTAIEVLDSRAVAGSLGFIVLEAARLASQGAGLAQVKEAARNVMNKVSFLGMLDTLYYLARTGRIARAAAWAGSLLNVKPIVGHFPSVGETTPVARPRSKVKGLEHMLEMIAERIGGSKAHIMVQHADELEEAEKLKATIESRFDCSELLLTEFSSGMGVHCGPGLLAVSFYSE
jgi:DegV family protein with EDD domain